MTSKEMLKAPLPKGKIFYNKAKFNSKPNWVIIDKPKDWK
jgi:hypothetical protein